MSNKKYRLSTALDVDDLLMECTSYAIRLANEKYKFDPPLTIYEKSRWGKIGTRADSIYPYFRDADFYRQIICRGDLQMIDPDVIEIHLSPVKSQKRYTETKSADHRDNEINFPKPFHGGNITSYDR